MTSASASELRSVLDESLLLERLGGDREALAQLVDLFFADAPLLVEGLRRAIEEKDAHALQATAHTLKGAVSNFAAARATEAAAPEAVPDRRWRRARGAPRSW